MQDMMNTAIWDGKTITDLLTIQFMASIFGSVIAAALILFLGFIIGGWLRRRLIRLGENNRHLDITLFNFLGNMGRYVAIGFAFLFVLNTFGIQTTSFVAVIGAAGLAIGLALQGTLSNVAAGVMIVFFRPIRIGDFVEVSGQMGTVKEITLNFTELAAPSNVQVIIPNARVWGNTILNYSIYETRRAEWIFGVGYGTNLKDAEDVIRNTIMADPRSKTDPAPFIQVDNLNSSSVDFLVRVWCNSGDYFQYQADMKRLVKEALDNAGINIPFPTQTIIQASA
ncbi:mechanosensitive ion channel domain-containing protein [Yoonia sp.]|uniref:mechanosensitive ion channel family protein n=1 Tax=Yoonia sp. TaxID=2212373 RepID=UPI0025CD7DB8|nr:mechanosensitive ion channel domain-containing protein [Yoonia sp.]